MLVKADQMKLPGKKRQTLVMTAGLGGRNFANFGGCGLFGRDQFRLPESDQSAARRQRA